MNQALGQVSNQNNVIYTGANSDTPPDLQQQGSANGYAVKALLDGVKSAFSGLSSAIPSPGSFSLTEKIGIVATGTMYISQKVLAQAGGGMMRANCTMGANSTMGVNCTMEANSTMEAHGMMEANGTMMADAMEGSESLPGWKIALTVIGVTAGTAGLGLGALCAWQNRDKLCPTDKQRIPSEPSPEGDLEKEMGDVGSKATTDTQAEKTATDETAALSSEPFLDPPSEDIKQLPDQSD